MEKTTAVITTEFIREFAKLSLEITEDLKQRSVEEIDPAMIRELRENAQALVVFLPSLSD
jgi:hypothetical protein